MHLKENKEVYLKTMARDYKAIVIGGGFYGCTIATYLANKKLFGKVLLIERENDLLTRASYNNQARVHNGYHYPRSFTTAFRSRINMPRFVADWPEAVKEDFTKVYAISRKNSKVTAKQFLKFCDQIGATTSKPSSKIINLFNPKLIEDVFLVKEFAFDTTKLTARAKEELHSTGVDIIYNTKVSQAEKTQNGITLLLEINSSENIQSISCDYVFNCSYSGLNNIKGSFEGTRSILKHEVTEMALVEPPPNLNGLGVTVMDGPFFSLMPFPAQNLYTLSHVRYTPHYSWNDCISVDPYSELDNYEQKSRHSRMIRDSARYLPDIANSMYKRSLFEIKTVLMKNESDDGRPILFEKSKNIPGFYSILGGKVDNIYDIIEKLNKEKLE